MSEGMARARILPITASCRIRCGLTGCRNSGVFDRKRCQSQSRDSPFACLLRSLSPLWLRLLDMVGCRDVGSVGPRGPMVCRVQALSTDSHGPSWDRVCPCVCAYNPPSAHHLVCLVALACMGPARWHALIEDPGTLRGGTCHLRIYQRRMRVPPFPHADTTSVGSKAGVRAPAHSSPAQGTTDADGATFPLQHIERDHKPDGAGQE